MPVRPLARLENLALRAFTALTVLFVASPSLAVTDPRAVQGAADSLGPAIPEPSSILLFLAGVGVVAWGVKNRRSRID